MNDAGRTVLQVLSDYQSLYRGGDGYLRKMIFDPGAVVLAPFRFRPIRPRKTYRTGPQEAFSYTATFGSTVHIGPPLLKTWQGDGGNQWNLNTSNLVWQQAPRYFLQDDEVRFDSTAVTRTINVTATVTPFRITVDNPAGSDFAINSSADGLGGKISGRGGLYKLGTGVLILAGLNDFSGATAVSGGTLKLTGSAANTSGVAIGPGGAKLDLAGIAGSSLAATTAVTNDGTLEVSSNLTQNVGAISGTGATLVGPGAGLTATSIVQDTLTIGAGGSVTIRATSGGGANAVPEPSSFALLGVGVAGILAFAWRRPRTST